MNLQYVTPELLQKRISVTFTLYVDCSNVIKVSIAVPSNVLMEVVLSDTTCSRTYDCIVIFTSN